MKAEKKRSYEPDPTAELIAAIYILLMKVPIFYHENNLEDAVASVLLWAKKAGIKIKPRDVRAAGRRLYRGGLIGRIVNINGERVSRYLLEGHKIPALRRPASKPED